MEKREKTVTNIFVHLKVHVGKLVSYHSVPRHSPPIWRHQWGSLSFGDFPKEKNPHRAVLSAMSRGKSEKIRMPQGWAEDVSFRNTSSDYARDNRWRRNGPRAEKCHSTFLETLDVLSTLHFIWTSQNKNLTRDGDEKYLSQVTVYPRELFS